MTTRDDRATTATAVCGPPQPAATQRSGSLSERRTGQLAPRTRRPLPSLRPRTGLCPGPATATAAASGGRSPRRAQGAHRQGRRGQRRPRTRRRRRQRASCGHARPRRCDRARQCGTRCGSRAGRGSATRRSAGQATLPKRYRPRPRIGPLAGIWQRRRPRWRRPRRIGMPTGVSGRRVASIEERWVATLSRSLASSAVSCSEKGRGTPGKGGPQIPGGDTTLTPRHCGEPLVGCDPPRPTIRGSKGGL